MLWHTLIRHVKKISWGGLGPEFNSASFLFVTFFDLSHRSRDFDFFWKMAAEKNETPYHTFHDKIGRNMFLGLLLRSY